MPTIAEALTEFRPESVTFRLLSTLYRTIPYSPEFAHWTSVDDAVRAIHPTAGRDVYLRARDIADNTEALQDLLWMARMLDLGDKGVGVPGAIVLSNLLPCATVLKTLKYATTHSAAFAYC